MLLLARRLLSDLFLVLCELLELVLDVGDLEDASLLALSDLLDEQLVGFIEGVLLLRQDDAAFGASDLGEGGEGLRLLQELLHGLLVFHECLELLLLSVGHRALGPQVLVLQVLLAPHV